MEMRSTCNLVDVQTMCRIYITIDIHMLIIMYTLLIVYHYICCACAMLWRILQMTLTLPDTDIVTIYANAAQTHAGMVPTGGSGIFDHHFVLIYSRSIFGIDGSAR